MLKEKEQIKILIKKVDRDVKKRAAMGMLKNRKSKLRTKSRVNTENSG
jgi:hypothetical protein